MLASASVEHLIKEWDRLYGIRSGVFHGTAQLSEPELHKAGQETITLCAKILFAIISKEGIRVPTIAKIHTTEIPACGWDVIALRRLRLRLDAGRLGIIKMRTTEREREREREKENNKINNKIINK